MGGTGSQGITRVGRMVLARLMETLLWLPPVYTDWVGKGLDEGTMASQLGGGRKSGRSKEAAVTGGETMGLSICSSLGEGTLQ